MKDTHTDSATVWSLIKAGQINKSFTAEACRSQGQLQSGSDKSLSVCVCGLVNSTFWGQNVPTKMAISEILVLVGAFFGPQEENSL